MTVEHVFYVVLFVVVFGVLLWDFGYFRKGRHRGVYRPPGPIVTFWDRDFNKIATLDGSGSYRHPEIFTWTGSTTTANPSLHELFWEDHGRWGDVSVDLADYPPVRGDVAGGDIGSPER